MNSEMGFSLRTPASDGACLRDDPRGARHWGASSRRKLHMRIALSSGCFLGFSASSLFGAGKAVLRPVACDQVRGARGRGQGTETLAKLGGLPPSVACVSQRLDA